MGWSPRIHTGLHVSCATLDTHMPCSVSVTGLLPCFVQLSRSLHLPNSNQLLGPNPKDISISGLASCNFARHYFRNRLFTFSSSRYLDVSVPWVPSVRLCIHLTVTLYYQCCVPTFGYLRIFVHLQLPVAFRSLSRPSSAPDAKASTICSL